MLRAAGCPGRLCLASIRRAAGPGGGLPRQLSLLLAVVLSLGSCLPSEPSPPVPPAPPLPPLETVLGVHTRLTDEVEEAKIARTLQMVRDMGAGWIVEYFPWAYIEPERGQFDWHHADLVVEHASQLGLRVVARIDYVPAWARPADSPTRLLPPSSYPDYAAFVARFAARYAGRVRYVVVWNEPNVSFEWGFRPVDPAEYVRLLRTTAEAVRAAAPTTRVVSAGLAPTLEHSQWAMDDISYLEAMYRAGAAAYFDVLGAHAYGFREPPDAPADAGELNFSRLELLRAVMVRHGDAEKPVLVTESGWNDHPRWNKAVRPGQRIAYTLAALDRAEREWPWLLALNLWAFRLPRPARNYNDGYTYVTADFQPRPIYEALRQRQEERGVLALGEEAR